MNVNDLLDAEIKNIQVNDPKADQDEVQNDTEEVITKVDQSKKRR